MKIFILIASLVAISMAVTPKEKLREYSNLCIPISGVTQETLDKVKNDEEINDPKLKEHALCTLKKSEFMNEAGELQIETIKTKLKQASDNPEKVDKLVKRCAVTKATPQETASNFVACIHKKHEHN